MCWAVLGAMAADQIGLPLEERAGHSPSRRAAHMGWHAREDGRLLSVGLGSREGAVRQNEVRLAVLDILEALKAGHHTPPRTDVPLWRLPVRVQAARLRASHEFALQCDESDRHVIALATRFGGIGGGAEVRRELGRCDPNAVLRVGLAQINKGNP